MLCSRRRSGLARAQTAAEHIQPQQMHQREHLRQQLGALEPLAETGVLAMLRVELAHHHHALPVGNGHQQRPAPLLPEPAERLRRLVLLVRRKIAGAQHEAALVLHGVEDAIDLPLQAAALRGPVAQENARLRAEPRRVTQRQIDGGQLVGQRDALRRRLDRPAPLVSRQCQCAGEHAHQAVVVAGNIRFGLRHEAVPVVAELDRRRRRCVIRIVAAAGKSQRRRQRRNEALLFLGLGRRIALLLAHARLGQLQDAPGRKPAELLEELRTEIQRWIGAVVARVLLQPLGDDETRLFGGARLDQRHGAGLLDAVDVGLRQHLAHLAVELGQARHQHDRRRHAIGDLDQVARGLLEAFRIVVEEAQVLDLVDGEHQRRAVHRPHQAAERLDDLERTPLAGIGIERRHRLLREVVQLVPVEILAHALVDARVGTLHVEQRAHDIDVEVLAGKLRRGDDLVRNAQHELGERAFAELGVPQLVERGRVHDRGIADQAVGQPRQRALAALVGVVGLFQRGHQTAQVVVGVVGHVRRHLRIAEVGPAGAVGTRAQRADQVRLAGAGLAMEQQNACLHLRGAIRRHGAQQVGELAPRGRMHQLDVDRIGPPDVVLPRNGVLEGR